jgi:hypothetical protein
MLACDIRYGITVDRERTQIVVCYHPAFAVAARLHRRR